MKVGLSTRTGGSWSPTELGRSLPIHRPLKRWRIGSAIVAGAIALAIAGYLWSRQHPRIDEPMKPADARSFAARQLARVDVPRLDLGTDLAPTEPPPFPQPPAPPPWKETPGWDPVPWRFRDELERAEREMTAGQWTRAATLYQRAAEGTPDAWLPRFDAGLALLARGDAAGAQQQLEDALRRLRALGAGGPDAIAADIATRRALAAALLEDDCIGAIAHLKVAVGELPAYVRAADVLVDKRDFPFPVDPAGLDSVSVWLDLVHAYSRCDGRYPEEYMRTRDDPQTFRDEYDDPNVAAVRDGPFPAELAACIAASQAQLHSEPSRCWVLSNLNRLHEANAYAFKRLESAAKGSGSENPGALGRLAYAVAWTLSDREESQPRASRYLAQAQALAREAEDPWLTANVKALGRHLAPETRDYSTLAGDYDETPLDELVLDDRTPPEAVKGIAWRLQERWTRLVREGQADAVMTEVERQRHRSGPYGSGLLAWKKELQGALRAELVTTMKQARDNGNTALAVALRDLDAPYLGEEWEDAAVHGWRPYGLWAAWFAAWLVLVALLWAVYRFVVYPYLVDTSDYYRLEFAGRKLDSRRTRPAP